MSASRKVIITCAVTGAIHTPSMSPYLPITPDQIVEDRYRKFRKLGPLTEPTPPTLG